MRRKRSMSVEIAEGIRQGLLSVSPRSQPALPPPPVSDVRLIAWVNPANAQALRDIRQMWLVVAERNMDLAIRMWTDAFPERSGEELDRTLAIARRERFQEGTAAG